MGQGSESGGGEYPYLGRKCFRLFLNQPQPLCETAHRSHTLLLQRGRICNHVVLNGTQAACALHLRQMATILRIEG